MRLLIIGNCQAEPIAWLLADRYEVDAVDAVMVHRPAQRRAARALLAQDYDAVFAQPIREGYPFEEVRMSAIRERYPGVVITWPVIFFRGYNPELHNIRINGEKLYGPLGMYHIGTLASAFSDGLSPAAAAKRLADAEYNAELYRTAPEESLRVLKERETDVDITISSFIEANYMERRLFHTYNHPSNEVLLRIVDAIAERAELVPKAVVPESPEYLDKIRPAPNPYLGWAPAMGSANERTHLGMDESKNGGYSKQRPYSDAQIADAFYSLYIKLGLEFSAETTSEAVRT